MRSLPPCGNTGLFIVEPIVVLDRRLARRGNGAEMYMLVQWANGWEARLMEKMIIELGDDERNLEFVRYD
ncbi:hypothetical protein Tco_1146757 [Tanacetum coccineum]